MVSSGPKFNYCVLFIKFSEKVRQFVKDFKKLSPSLGQQTRNKTWSISVKKNFQFL